MPEKEIKFGIYCRINEGVYNLISEIDTISHKQEPHEDGFLHSMNPLTKVQALYVAIRESYDPLFGGIEMTTEEYRDVYIDYMNKCHDWAIEQIKEDTNESGDSI